jgi:CRP-like cAMP-binding protein
MPRRARPVFRNRLLGAMSRADRGLIEPHLEPISLALRQPIEEPDTPVTHAYFVEEGIISVVAIGPKQTQIEVGLVGPEGMTGLPILMGDHRSPNATFVQAVGHAYRISAVALRKAMGSSRTLQPLLLRFAQTFMVQASQTAVANGRSNLDERLARWILMAQDRLERDRLPLTHQFLALMLGVRRAGVTDTLNLLEGEGLIRAQRGEITVLSRTGLEQRANHSYGVPEAEYRRLIG